MKVRDRQFLGNEVLYCLQLPSGKEMHVRDADELRPLSIGTPVRLQVKPGHKLLSFPQKNNSD